MSQLTLEILDYDLSERLERLATERGVSLEEAAVIMMRRGAGLNDRPDEGSTVGDSLDRFIGPWTSGEEAELLDSISSLGFIDESG